MSMIKFETTHYKSIDIADSWVSTNTQWEIIIIKNIKDKYELWLEDDTKGYRDNELVGIYDTFDIAVLNAQTIVDVYEPSQGNIDDWTPQARGWCM